MEVICICGKARAGKDTAAGYLRDALKTKGKKVLIFHYADLLKFLCKQYFEWNGEKDETGRTLLQRIGTDVIRKKMPDYWVKFLNDILYLFSDEWDYVIIPDCRFHNEICGIDIPGRDSKIRTMRITRGADFDNGLTEEQKKHPSETALDNFPVDVAIYNGGSLERLRRLMQDYVNCVLESPSNEVDFMISLEDTVCSAMK